MNNSCVCGTADALMYDGSYKKIQDLKKNDTIYGVHKDGCYTKFTPSKVISVKKVNCPAYEITLHNETNIICSKDTRWATNRGHKYVAGDTTGTGRRPFITISNNLLGFNYSAVSKVIENDDYMMGYLSGVIRGDGSIGHYDYSGNRGRHIDEQHCFRLALKYEPITNRVKTYLEHFNISTNTFDFSMIDRKTKEPIIVKAIRTNRKTNISAIESVIKFKVNLDFLKGFLAGIYDAEGTSDLLIKRIFNANNTIVGYTMKALNSLSIPYTWDKSIPTKNTVVKTIRLLDGISSTIKLFNSTNPLKSRYACLDGVSLKNIHPDSLKIKSIHYKGYCDLYTIKTSTNSLIVNGAVCIL